MTERKMTEVEMYFATLALCVLPNLKTASGEVLTWEGVRTDDATSTRFLCADGGREHVATIYNNGRVYCYRAHKKNREIEDGDITAAFEHVCRELYATPVNGKSVEAEANPTSAPPTPTTGIKHDASKPTWWLMPWGAVKRVADNGALSSIFRAYADAAGRTYDAFAWAQLGHTIIARKLGESPLDGISDATMWQAFGEVHKVLEYGAAKYDAHNWQNVLGGPNGPQRYVEACRRHLMADAAGEVNDAESGLPHWAHALCCCLFLIYNAEAGGEK